MTVPHHSEPAREAVALLPCPFCGGTELVIREDISEDEPKRPYAFHVFCRSCHCHGRNNFPIGWAETEQSARDAWNTRASPAPAAGGLEAVREALERVRCDCQSTIDLYHRTGPSFTSPGGDEYEPTSFVIAKMEELISIARAALAPSTFAATRGERVRGPVERDDGSDAWQHPAPAVESARVKALRACHAFLSDQSPNNDALLDMIDAALEGRADA